MGILDPIPTGDKSFHYVQATPASIWTITHNLGKFPDVQIFTSAGDMIEGEIHHVSGTQLTATFTAPFSGDAYLN